jgi:hypothetical protein
MANLLDNIRNLWRKKDDKPVVPPAPEPPKPAPPATMLDKIRALALLREIPFDKLMPVFISIPAIVFFAISGVLAWIMLTLKFMIGIFNL